jgi:ADP-ribosylglycohydrolase
MAIACIPPAPAPGDAAGLRERARGALLGLAVGDALGAPAENLRPSEIRARWGRITGYVAEQPSGTDDTEYTIFSGLMLARHGSALTVTHVEAAWHQWIADRDEGPFRGAGFSERGTLENLRRGLAAPITAQHRHAWSDGLAMRAAPFGVFAAGRPAEAARLVAIDGSVSHEGEGIYGGQAVAAGVAAAMAGAPTVAVVASALAVVPDDSWTARSLRRAVAAAHRGARAVRSAVVIGGYPWTDLAPEAVALAFGAYAAADGDFTESVLTAVNMGRDADTTAAVAGALAGATHGISAIPAEWAAAIGPARGSCLPSMEGHHVLDVAELLTPGDGKWGAAIAGLWGRGTGVRPGGRVRREGHARGEGGPARRGDTVRGGHGTRAGDAVRDRGPAGPGNPARRAGRTRRADPARRGGPTPPAGTAEPDEHTELVGTGACEQPVGTKEPGKPVSLAEPEDPAEPAGTIKPETPDGLAEPGHRTEPVRGLTEPGDPTESVGPAPAADLASHGRPACHGGPLPPRGPAGRVPRGQSGPAVHEVAAYVEVPDEGEVKP